MSKTIQLTQGKVAIVDDEDYEELSKYKWHYHAKGYAARGTTVSEGLGRLYIFMQRQILNAPKDMQVDHINRNRLDNRKSNLRLATRAENSRNSINSSKNANGYRGVKFDKRYGSWSAQIEVDGKHMHLGTFESSDVAARAYDEAAIKYHGAFAMTNKRLGLL